MKKTLSIILLLMLFSCSVILVSKSNNTTINQRLDEDLDADVNLFSKKDTIKNEANNR